MRIDLSADCIAPQDVGVQIPRLGARVREGRRKAETSLYHTAT
jgi:hypothetical protein